MKRVLALVMVCAALSLWAETAVPASKFGYNAEDATECLQTALKSGAKQIRIDKQAGDWIIRPVEVPGNVEIILDPDVTVRAKKGEYKDVNDSMFSLWDISNVTISGGKGSRLVMNRADYQDPKQYKQGEWRMLIRICSCSNVTVRNLILDSSGGDAIYVGTSNRPDASTDLLFEDLEIVNNHRQGISINHCRKVRISRCNIHDTNGTSPMAGIDFEGEHACESYVDCIVEDCKIYNNKGFGILFHNYLMDRKVAPPMSVTIRNCEISGGKNGAIVVNSCNGISQLPGFIRFENCRFSGVENSSLVIRNHRNDGFALNFDNVVFDNSKSNALPVQIISEASVPIGNITFNKVTITDPNHREWSSLSSTGARPELKGEVDFNGKKNDLAEWSKAQKVEALVPFTPAKLDVKKLTVNSDAPCKLAPGFRFRGEFTVLQYAKRGAQLDIALEQVDGTFKVDVIDPNGKKIDELQMKPGKNPIRFTAKESGYYSFKGNTNGAIFTLVSAMPGSGVSAAETLGLYDSCDRKLYFEVPVGAKDVMLRFRGDPGEAVSVRIYNGKGQLMGKLHDVTLAKAFCHTRFFTEQAEVWTLEFVKMVEDSKVELGGDLNPVVALSPELLPRAVK